MSRPAAALDTYRDELRSLVDEYRTWCLWFLRADHYPATSEEAVRVLRQIERHADLDGYRRAARLRAWLSPTANAPSAGS